MSSPGLFVWPILICLTKNHKAPLHNVLFVQYDSPVSRVRKTSVAGQHLEVAIGCTVNCRASAIIIGYFVNKFTKYPSVWQLLIATSSSIATRKVLAGKKVFETNSLLAEVFLDNLENIRMLYNVSR